MLEFYLNNTRVYAEANSTLTEKIGDLSGGQLILELQNIKSPIIPMTTLSIWHYENETFVDNWDFVVIADNVETAKKTSSKLYKHTLTLQSSVYKTKKYLLRNSVFTQPAYSNYTTTLNGSFYVDSTTSSVLSLCTAIPYPYKNFSFNPRQKVNGMKLTLETELIPFQTKQGNNFSNPNISQYDTSTRFIVSFTRYDNGTQTMTDDFTFEDTNKTIYLTSAEVGLFFNNMTENTSFRLTNPEGATFTITGARQGALAITKVKAELTTYYYSLYDVIDIICKQANKHYNGYDTRETFILRARDYSDHMTLLDSIIAPEFNFTGVDVYTALYQVLSYIDAIPIFDDLGYFDFQFLNDYDTTPTTPRISDEKLTLTDEYFTNKFVSNYQNGKSNIPVIYPAKNKYKRIDTKGYGVPSNDDYIIKLPYAIDYIDRVYLYGSFDILSFHAATNVYFTAFSLHRIDITSQVYEQTLYSVLNEDAGIWGMGDTKNNTCYYTKGGNTIDLLGYATKLVVTRELYTNIVKVAIMKNLCLDGFLNLTFNETLGNYPFTVKSAVQYCVEYHGIYTGRLEQVSQENKIDGESVVSQTNGGTSLNRMGNNLQGLIARAGNIVENLALDVSTYGSRMRAGSLWVDDDGNRYIANIVKTTFSTSSDNVIVEAQFSKNFNMLSQYTQIDQEKRFYEISRELTTTGYENITEYVYFTYGQPQVAVYEPAFTSDFLYNLTYVSLEADAISSWYYNRESKGSYAIFTPYTIGGGEITTYPLYIPMHSYGSGNSICFEMGFDDPINAGNRLVGTEDTNLYTESVLYTDSTGFADRIGIKCYNASRSGSETLSYMPEIRNTPSDRKVFDIDLNYYKKPTEIFHLNYAVAFMSKNLGLETGEFFFGDALIENNAVLPNSQFPKGRYFYYGNGKYSILDKKPLANQTRGMLNNFYFSIEEQSYSGAFYIKLTLHAYHTACESWCITDENKNIILASNKDLEQGSTIVFYVVASRNRL